MRDAFISELTRQAEVDDSVFLVIGDLGFGVIEEFASRFPDRFLNAGVAEQTMVSAAAGLAESGYKVFCYSIANFPTARPLEQIRNDVAYHQRSVTIVSVGGGVAYGNLGYTHHAVEDLALMRCLPRMTVMSPADPVEVRGVTRYIVSNPGPSYLRLGKNGETTLHDEDVAVTPNRGLMLRTGTDVTLLCTGSIAAVGLEAARRLSEDGIEAAVVSVPFVKPLADEIVREAASRGPILTLEEHSTTAGFGSAVLEAAAKLRLRVPIDVAGLSEELAGHHIGSQRYLRDLNGLDAPSIAARARELLARSV